MDSDLKSVRREIEKYTNWGATNNEATRDQLAKKSKDKEGVTATKLKPPALNVTTESSTQARSLLPTKSILLPKSIFLAKSQLLDHDAEVERDSSASPVVVRPSLPPRSPKPIRPAVGNITTSGVPYGLAMEDWEVSPGIVRTAINNINSGGHGKFIRGAVSVSQVLALTPHRSCFFGPPYPQ